MSSSNDAFSFMGLRDLRIFLRLGNRPLLGRSVHSCPMV